MVRARRRARWPRYTAWMWMQCASSRRLCSIRATTRRPISRRSSSRRQPRWMQVADSRCRRSRSHASRRRASMSGPKSWAPSTKESHRPQERQGGRCSASAGSDSESIGSVICSPAPSSAAGAFAPPLAAAAGGAAPPLCAASALHCDSSGDWKRGDAASAPSPPSSPAPSSLPADPARSSRRTISATGSPAMPSLACRARSASCRRCSAALSATSKPASRNFSMVCGTGDAGHGERRSGQRSGGSTATPPRSARHARCPP